MTRLMPQWIAELSDCDRNHVGPQVEKSLDLYGESMTASNGVDLGGSEPVEELEKFWEGRDFFGRNKVLSVPKPCLMDSIEHHGP